MGSVVVENVGKAYKHYDSHFARLLEWLLPFAKPRHTPHWVLRHADLVIQPGETVGLVGVNGAGKSTLLKMIAGTTLPSEGRIHVDGDVAALLELGMGFHQDFTGRQNVYMAGQLRGLSRAEISELMPAIEAFAEIGEYIDQPLRVYSSGMQMRLAFSVATARRPAILIVDEALSVGDAYFQHKSFKRIREFREQGSTLLIVSHDRNAIQALCDRVLLLDGGCVLRAGRPEEVMDFYNALLAEREQHLIRQEVGAAGQVQTISGSGEASIRSVVLLNAQGQASEVLKVGEPVRLRVTVDVRQDVPRLILGFMIKDRLGQAIYGINTHRLDQALENLAASDEVVYEFSFPMNLGKGHYSIAFSLSRFDSHLDTNYEWRDGGIIFHVVHGNNPDFVGCTWLDTQLRIERSAVPAST